MMSTADESSKFKNSSSLTSSDLVSRYLAATPSYLYNVSPIQHNFFFSEMLRSLVQTKNKSIISQNNLNIQRRKKSWRYSLDQPLELTTKARNQNRSKTSISTIRYNQHYHQIESNTRQHKKLFRSYQHQYLKESQLQNSFIENENKIVNHDTNYSQETIDNVSKRKINYSTNSDYLLKNEQLNNYFTEGILSNSQNKFLFTSNLEKISNNEIENMKSKTDLVNNKFLKNSTRSLFDDTLISGQKIKLNPSSNHFFTNFSDKNNELQATSNFNTLNSIIPDILPSPIWYPHYTTQTYPAIDPLHLFIDLHVSGHIWDQKGHEKYIFNKNKHHSAFRVLQNKECNRPLNLTRRETTFTRYSSENSKGTHYILKNIKRTYEKIWNSENCSISNTTNKNYNETKISSNVTTSLEYLIQFKNYVITIKILRTRKSVSFIKNDYCRGRS